MGVERKQHSAEFKARVAMAALSGEKTLAELSAEFGVHPTMISNWKQELVTRAGELFGRGSKAPAVANAQKVIDDLHRGAGLPKRFAPFRFTSWRSGWIDGFAWLQAPQAVFPWRSKQTSSVSVIVMPAVRQPPKS